MTASLLISLSETVAPPTADHRLLLAFHFGDRAASSGQPGIVRVGLCPVDRDEVFECWWVDGEVRHSSNGPIDVIESEDFAAFVFKGDERGSTDFADYTFNAYEKLLDVVRMTEHPRLLKIWNYMGGLNEGDGDKERYRLFSKGRATAFDRAGMLDSAVPAGTGIGTKNARGLEIIALASKRPIDLIENPRQISAFSYPRQYGPRSPKFSRGASLDMGDYRLCLISGTASIVGHESLHPGDIVAQLAETLRNLDALCGEYSAICPEQPPLRLGEQSVLRVYLRNPDDYQYVARQLQNALAPGDFEAVFLEGDICRPELVLEIDGLLLQ